MTSSPPAGGDRFGLPRDIPAPMLPWSRSFQISRFLKARRILPSRSPILRFDGARPQLRDARPRGAPGEEFRGQSEPS